MARRIPLVLDHVLWTTILHFDCQSGVSPRVNVRCPGTGRAIYDDYQCERLKQSERDRLTAVDRLRGNYESKLDAGTGHAYLYDQSRILAQPHQWRLMVSGTLDVF